MNRVDVLWGFAKKDKKEAVKYLRDNGIYIDVSPDYQAALYRLDGVALVILCDNTIITRIQDNSSGFKYSIFPYYGNQERLTLGLKPLTEEERLEALMRLGLTSDEEERVENGNL